MRNTNFPATAILSLAALILAAGPQTVIENFENEVFAIRDVNLGAAVRGTNTLSVRISNRTGTERILAIDIRTECFGFGMTNQQRPEHYIRARTIFNDLFPFFEDLDPLRVVPLIAPVPLLIVSGTEDEQFSIPGVDEVDSAAAKEYRKYGMLSGFEFYPEPRAGHWVSEKAGYIIGAFFERWPISIGGSFSYAEVLIAQANSQTPFEGHAFIHLEGDDKSAFGYNAGIMRKPMKELSIGASFRSEVDYMFEGTATTTGAEQLAAVLPQGNISAELTTPMNIQGGVGYRIIEQLQLSADFQWVGWSSYDVLAVDFENPDYDDICRPRDYEDTYAIRFGAEYFLNNELSFLGGIYFDKMPVQPEYLSPSLPDADRLGFSIGVDARILENFGISGSYLYIRSSELTVTNSREIYTPYDEGNEESASKFNGTYNSSASLFSFSFYYNF